MASKSLLNIVDQLKDALNEPGEGFSELTPEEAAELEGGHNGICPTNNNSCPQPPPGPK